MSNNQSPTDLALRRRMCRRIGRAMVRKSGGYKVQSRAGLYWTAAYLHDGDVAVGPNATRDVGVRGTWSNNTAPDPSNSVRAMIDRDLRRSVTTANADLPAMNVREIGHEFWVDPASGFTAEEQDALIAWLLTYTPPCR
jgi:hypothetical protein